MKKKKVIKLILLFATIKLIVSLATYLFQVITNYLNIKKNRVINRVRNPQEKAKEHHEKRAKLAKKNAIEKSNISNYFSKIQNEATTSDTDSDNNPAEETKISSNESESENQDEEEEPCSSTKCHITHFWVTKVLIGQPVNYAMIASTYYALILQTTTSKTLCARNV